MTTQFERRITFRYTGIPSTSGMKTYIHSPVFLERRRCANSVTARPR